MEKINTTGILPPGVHIETIYDRSDLIDGDHAHRAAQHGRWASMLIFLIQWLFLGDLRSALIVAATIPFALFFAILIMLLRGESANLLSVGAIDFGLVVDATVIMVENIFRHLARGSRQRAPSIGRAHSGLRGKSPSSPRRPGEVNKAIFFSAAIIIAGFVPLFTLSGVEGHIFGPMAKTYAYAIAGGLLATFTVSPALSALLLPDRVEETRNVHRALAARASTSRCCEFALANRILTLGGAGAAGRGWPSSRCASLGLEFLPHLEEGNFWIRATMPPSISLEEGNGYVNRMRA